MNQACRAMNIEIGWSIKFSLHHGAKSALFHWRCCEKSLLTILKNVHLYAI